MPMTGDIVAVGRRLAEERSRRLAFTVPALRSRRVASGWSYLRCAPSRRN
jgi:hypothetical protein